MKTDKLMAGDISPLAYSTAFRPARIIVIVANELRIESQREHSLAKRSSTILHHFRLDSWTIVTTDRGKQFQSSGALTSASMSFVTVHLSMFPANYEA